MLKCFKSRRQFLIKSQFLPTNLDHSMHENVRGATNVLALVWNENERWKSLIKIKRLKRNRWKWCDGSALPQIVSISQICQITHCDRNHFTANFVSLKRHEESKSNELFFGHDHTNQKNIFQTIKHEKRRISRYTYSPALNDDVVWAWEILWIWFTILHD